VCGGVREPNRDQALEAAYRRLLVTLEDACRDWLGADTASYAQVQIARIKNVVNGRVLRCLTRAIEQAGLAGDSLRRIAELRVEQVQRMLMDGHPLVPLETLRATNFSMLRAGWLTHQSKDSMGWPDVRPYLNALGTFAARASQGADDALAHEIARSYALCSFVSPENAAAGAFGLWEARVPPHIMQAVDGQLTLLLELFDRRAEGARAAVTRFRLVLRAGPDTDPGALSWYALIDDEWRRAYAPFGGLVEELHELCNRLERSPEEVRLEMVADIGASMKRPTAAGSSVAVSAPRASRPPRAGASEHFRVDGKFWSTSCDRLDATCRKFLPAPAPDDMQGEVAVIEAKTEGVDPALVLAGPDLADWAEECLRELEMCHTQRQIHGPHAGIYAGALERFAAVTRSLRASTAVQRRLVAGVLDHHTLERLDDHVLQLWETAHALDPEAAGASIARGPHPSHLGTVKRFAYTLGAQLREAEGVPKNLRTLYDLIAQRDGGDQPAQPRTRSITVEQLLEIMRRAFGLAPAGSRYDAVSREGRLLALIARELKQNYDVYGSVEELPQVERKQQTVSVRLLLHEDAHRRVRQRARLAALTHIGLRRFLSRDKDEESSNGMGLYLASLAAASIGYRLSVSYSAQDRDYVRFTLEYVS
jgi:hypothetical protein